uniref:Uncharacterized protein n=1 Tax=Leersia perrieri TaxID=77586 RepID=A0A0D9V1L7_9ORYZ
MVMDVGHLELGYLLSVPLNSTHCLPYEAIVERAGLLTISVRPDLDAWRLAHLIKAVISKSRPSSISRFYGSHRKEKNRMLESFRIAFRCNNIAVPDLRSPLIIAYMLAVSMNNVSENEPTKYQICRVQEQVRVLDRNCYEPMILSIGPYHHDSPCSFAMLREKWECLAHVLGLNQERELADYIHLVGELEDKIRNCYSEEVKLESNRFIKMILLDGCFILVQLSGLQGIAPSMQDTRPDAARESSTINKKEHGDELKILKPGCSVAGNSELVEKFRLSSFNRSKSHRSQTEDVEHDQKLDTSDQVGQWYHSCVAHDVLLLENQIPFFIVRRIYELVAGERATHSSPQFEIAGCVEGLLHYYPKATREAQRPCSFNHLLHLCHIYFRPSSKLDDERRLWSEPRYDTLRHGQCRWRWRRVIHYREAGIEFRKREFDEHNPHSLLDITFMDGVITIPRLIIDIKTTSHFRNLIGFEQTCPLSGNDFTAYVTCLSQLMSMPEDVSLLAKRGIIVHQMRSDQEVSTLLSKLGKNVDIDLSGNSYLKHAFSGMEEHYQSRINRWNAWLWQNHFSNPWLVLAVLAAGIILICTLVQTLISLLAYKNQK